MDLRPGTASPVETNGARGDPNGFSQLGSADERRLSLYRWVFRKLLPELGIPLRIELWNGDAITTGPGRPVAVVRIRDRWTLMRLLFNPDLGFGDGYSDGQIEVDGDLVALLEVLFRA